MKNYFRLMYDTDTGNVPGSGPSLGGFGGAAPPRRTPSIPPEILAKIADIVSVGVTNSRSKDWQEMMYGRQRSDALEDWNRMNAYNSPGEQMMRLKNAGLNPNLAYGSVNAVSPAIRASSAGNWKPEAPAVGPLADSIAAYRNFNLDTRVKEAQIDTMETIRSLNIQKSLLAAADVGNKTADTRLKEFGLQFKKDIRDYSLQAADWSVRKMQADVTRQYTDVGVGEARIKVLGSEVDKNMAELRKIAADTNFTIDANKRAWALQANSINEGLERIELLMKQQAKTSDEREEITQRISEMKASAALKNVQADQIRNGDHGNGTKELLGFLLGTILRKGK